MRRALILFTGLGLMVLAFVGFLSVRKGAGARAAQPSQPATMAVGDKTILRRLDAKAVVTRRLIDGELTLADAAAWFHDLDANKPPAGAVSGPMDATPSEEERCCREVIRWAQAQASAEAPEQAEALVHRLEAELVVHLKDAAR